MTGDAPGITAIIPTQGRASLERALRSCQNEPERDEVLVVLDTHGMDGLDAQEVRERALGARPGVRVLEHDAGHHCWGHCQINAGMAAARPGSYLTFNDDDDVYAPEAWEAIRREAIRADVEAGQPRLHIFRFQSYHGTIYPEHDTIAEHHVGGHCFVAPNVEGWLGRWSCRYQGDYDFIEGTVQLWGAALFHDDLIAIARPRGGTA